MAGLIEIPLKQGNIFLQLKLRVQRDTRLLTLDVLWDVSRSLRTYVYLRSQHNSVFADDLVPICVRPCGATTMTYFGSRLYTG